MIHIHELKIVKLTIKENLDQIKSNRAFYIIMLTPYSPLFQKIKVKNYILEEIVDKSLACQVFRAIDMNSGNPFAIKQYSKSFLNENKDYYDLLKIQIWYHKTVDSNFIIKYHECLETSDNIYVVMDYLHEQTLKNYMITTNQSRFDEKTVVFIFIQLLYATKSLRDKRFFCRDMTLGNIFVKTGSIIQLILGDLGLMKSFLHYNTESNHFSTQAPELLLSSKPLSTSKVDIWSLGCILYRLITGREPFYGENREQYIENVKSNSGKLLEIPNNVSQEARELLSGMLTLEAEYRVTFGEILKSKLIKKYAPSLEIEIYNQTSCDITNLWTEVDFNANKSELNDLKNNSPIEQHFMEKPSEGFDNYNSKYQNLKSILLTQEILKEDFFNHLKNKRVPLLIAESQILADRIKDRANRIKNKIGRRRYERLKLRSKIGMLCLKKMQMPSEYKTKSFLREISQCNNNFVYQIGKKHLVPIKNRIQPADKVLIAKTQNLVLINKHF